MPKIELTKNVNIERKIFVARVKVLKERQDLRNILNNFSENFESKDRLLNYLKTLGLLDTYGKPTNLGRRAMNDAMVPLNEYGSYEFWYLKDDNYGVQAFAFNRQSFENTSAWSRSGERIWFVDKPLMVFDNTNGIITELLSLKPESTKESNKTDMDDRDTAKLVSESDDFNQKAEFLIKKDKIKWSDKDKQIDLQIPLVKSGKDMSVKDYLIKILDEKFDVEFDSLLINSVPDNQYEVNFFERKVFEQQAGPWKVVIEQMPLRANNQTIAKEWMIRILINRWQKEYVTMERAKAEQTDLMNENAFKNHITKIREGDELINLVSSVNARAFWNLAIMQDLVPHNVDAQTHFTISRDDVKSRIDSMFFKTRSVEHIIISDRYLDRQNIAKLEHILPNDIPVKLFTQRKFVNSPVPDHWTMESLENVQTQRNDHARIWILKDALGWRFWTMDNSVTAFNINPGAKGKKDLVTVTPRKRDELPDYLIKEVEQ